MALFTPKFSIAQQNTDSEFARYLMATGQTQLGRLEWERLHFHSPGDTNVLIGYRDALRIERAHERALLLGRQFLESKFPLTTETILSIQTECARDAMWAKKYP
ncbi:MAG: hypothetical protein EBS53_13000, partial [Bacteroidetes bacterium]|nr:hypothetical protein [Bacteroidota bacterium]